MNIPDIDTTLTYQEAANMLGISVQKLARLRRNGKIQATRIGKSQIYVYTPRQVREANLTPEKRGPKRKA